MDRNQLVFLRLLIDHGKIHSKGTSLLDRTISIIHFHHAIELTVKQRAKEKLSIEKDFLDLLNELKNRRRRSERSINIPYEIEIRDLNRLRNNIYHNGLIHVPDTKTVFHFSKVIENFMKEFLNVEWSLDYDSISLVDLIDDTQIKGKIASGGRAKNRGNVKEAIVNLDQALFYVITKVLAKLGVYKLTVGGGFMLTTPTGQQINRDVALAQIFLFSEDYENLEFIQKITQQPDKASKEDFENILPLLVEIVHKAEGKYGKLPLIKAPFDK